MTAREGSLCLTKSMQYRRWLQHNRRSISGGAAMETCQTQGATASVVAMLRRQQGRRPLLREERYGDIASHGTSSDHPSIL